MDSILNGKIAKEENNINNSCQITSKRMYVTCCLKKNIVKNGYGCVLSLSSLFFFWGGVIKHVSITPCNL